MKHFTSEFYEDLTNEFAPFGLDEVFDVISLAEDHRDEVSEETTVQELLEIVDAPLSEEWSQTLKGQEALDDAVFISSAAFALIRITGRVDPRGHIASEMKANWCSRKLIWNLGLIPLPDHNQG